MLLSFIVLNKDQAFHVYALMGFTPSRIEYMSEYMLVFKKRGPIFG
jgi:hypothetical protein